MTETSDRYRDWARTTTAKIEAVPQDRWERPAPCDEWTARDVVRHLVDTSGTFLGLVDESLPAGPSVDDDPVEAWTNARDAVQRSLADPTIAKRTFQGVSGEMSFEEAVDGYLCFDLIVHAWDLARATGVDEQLDAAAVAEVHERAKSMVDMGRKMGAFGPAVDVTEDADEQTRLLSLLGRNV